MADKEVQVGPRTFKIRGTLGKGGFSVVYAGSDSETNKKVALKMMFDVKPDENDATYKQTCDEIKMMRRLQHKNLIKLLGYDLHANYSGRPCVILVQELAPNRELFEYLLHSESTFSERLVMYVMNNVCDAIGFMHEQGVAHRDLKPENILLDKEFTVKIADFGFAKYFHKHDQRMKMRTELGTRGYMAPEISENAQAASRANRKSYNEKVDTFALGVIFFICSSGFPPFRQTNSEDWWFDKIMKKQWHFFWKAHERKHTFNPLVKDLLEQMLCYSADERLAVKDCMKHPFFTNNPAGKMMTKEEYKNEMKGRYAIVKQKLRVVNQNKKEKSRAEPLPIADHAEKLEAYKGSFIPVELLCMNDIRNEIYQIADPVDEDTKAKLCQAIGTKVVDSLYGDRPAREQHDRASDYANYYKAMSISDVSLVKNMFCNATTAEELRSCLVNDEDDPTILITKLNHCELGTEASAEVSMNSVLQLQQFDKVELPIISPHKLTESMCFNVKYGFGTLVHFMKDLHNKADEHAAEVSIDVDAGSAIVRYEIQQSMELGDEELVVTDQVSILVQMYAFDDTEVDEEGNPVPTPPGFAIVCKPAGFLQTHLNAFDMCWNRMMEESNFLNELFINPVVDETFPEAEEVDQV